MYFTFQATSKRRFFVGINEVSKATQRRQVRCIIIASDLENVEMEGMFGQVRSVDRGTQAQGYFTLAAFG